MKNIQNKSSAVSGIEEIRRRAVPILKRYGVVRASFFGSMARGDYGPDSDVDLLINATGSDMSLFDLVRMKYELTEELGRKADVGFYHTLKPRIKESVMRQLVQIM